MYDPFGAECDWCDKQILLDEYGTPQGYGSSDPTDEEHIFCSHTCAESWDDAKREELDWDSYRDTQRVYELEADRGEF